MRGCYNTCISIFLEASRVRKEYDDASSKLSKIQSKISTLTEKLKHDFGKCHLKLCSLCDWVLLPVVYYSVATMDSCNFLLHQMLLPIVKSTPLSKFTLLSCYCIELMIVWTSGGKAAVKMHKKTLTRFGSEVPPR